MGLKRYDATAVSRQRVAVVSDTHAPRFWKACPPAVAEQLADVDCILHAGDVCTVDVLIELATYAPETLELVIAGVPIAMIHDSGPHDRCPQDLAELDPFP